MAQSRLGNSSSSGSNNTGSVSPSRVPSAAKVTSAPTLVSGQVSRVYEHLGILNSWMPTEEVRERLPRCFKRLLLCFSSKKQRYHDPQLIAAIARAYRSETGRFHINHNVELTLGLQDIWYITGLPIKGKAVIQKEMKPSVYLRNPKYLGIVDDAEVAKYDEQSTISLTDLKCLSEKCSNLDQKVRAYLLFMIGCLMYGRRVPFFFLSCMRKIEKVDKYAWGAAYLACMHNGLGKFRTRVHKHPYLAHMLPAPCHLIVTFMLERIKSMRELVFNFAYKDEAPHEHRLPDRLPLMQGWSEILVDFCQSHSNRIQLSSYIEVLEKETDSTIVWQPYKRTFYDIPKGHKKQLQVCKSLVEVFCFNMVALHEPNLKQLGVLETKPVSEKTKKALEKRRECKGQMTRLAGKRDLPYNWKEKPFYKKKLLNWKNKPWKSEGEDIEMIGEKEEPQLDNQRDPLISSFENEYDVDNLLATTPDGSCRSHPQNMRPPTKAKRTRNEYHTPLLRRSKRTRKDRSNLTYSTCQVNVNKRRLPPPKRNHDRRTKRRVVETKNKDKPSSLENSPGSLSF